MHARLIFCVLSTIALAARIGAQSLTVTTIAGQFWESGSADGAGRAARFNWPRNAVVDSAGNVYINDSANYTLRKMTPAGVVTTLAGSPGVRAYVDGVGSAARFYQPGGLARDSAGNLYVADLDLARGATGGVIRKITSAGAVSTYLTGLGGTILAMDAYDTLLVADGTQVRAFAANGREIVSNVATPGNVPRPPTGNLGPISAFVVDRSGSLYITDTASHSVRRVNALGQTTLLAGGAASGYADGTGTSARFNFPSSIAVDSSGNAYVTDSNNSVVRRVTPAGVVTTVLGAAGQPPVYGPDGRIAFPDGVGAAARLLSSQAIAIGANDTVYILDQHTVRRASGVTTPPRIVASPANQIAAAGERATFTVTANGFPEITYQWQRRAANDANWNNLADTAPYSGTRTAVLAISAVTASMTKDRFRCVVTNSLGSDTSAAAELTVDPPIVVVPLRVSTLAGRAGAGGGYAEGTGAAARFNSPHGVACDANGNIYVTEISAHLIRKITPGGVVSTFAGSGVAGAADGTGRSAQFRSPGAIAIDRSGTLYVVDRAFSTDNAVTPVIRKITPAGVVTTLARTGPGGQPLRMIASLACDRAGNVILGGDPTGLIKLAPNGAASFVPIPDGGVQVAGARAIAIDGEDNIYVATGNQTVLKLSPSGILSQLAGTYGVAGAIDGRGLAARFRGIQGLAVDNAGNIFVTDTGNQVIRRITPAGIVSTVAAIKPLPATAALTGSIDGIGRAARFNLPSGIAVDRGGMVYIADSQNHVIRRGVPVDRVAAGQSAEFYALTSGATVAGGADGAAGIPIRAASAEVTYQWFKDDQPIAGAVDSTFRIEAAGPADAGRYRVQVTTTDGPGLSEPVEFGVQGSRLANLSIRSATGPDAQTLTVGFVVEGSGLPLLIRGIGPSLEAFGIAGPVARPRLALHAGAGALAENAGWGDDPEVSDAAAQTGAFALPTGSRDAAMVIQLETGAFTVQCAGTEGGSGLALVELYDTNPVAAGRSRLLNVSARSQVGTGDDVMIAGFAITGTLPRRVLIRGIGPALAQFGVDGALVDPELKVFDGARVQRAGNDDWSRASNAAEVDITARRVGAFALANGSNDAALLLELAPGTYTVQLSGAGGAAGIGLIEIYEVP